MIREGYVSVDTAKALKAAGFNLRCRYLYRLESGKHVMRCARLESDFNAGDLMSCPSLGTATRWIREKGHHVYAQFGHAAGKWRFVVESVSVPFGINGECVFDTYEDAIEGGIMKALELISNFK